MDGTYDVPSLLSFLHTNTCRPVPLSVLSYERGFSRYCTFSGNPSIALTWPSPGTCSNANTLSDSIASVNPSTLAISHWKLIECGSSTNACLGDVLPQGPIQSLCSGINSSPRHSCDFESWPTTTHVQCGIAFGPIESCDTWFESLY